MAGGRPRPSADVSLNFLGADAPPVRSASRREGGLARSTILYRSWPEAARRSFDLARRISRRAHRRASSSRSTRSEEHTSELQSLMRISYAVFCLKKKKKKKIRANTHYTYLRQTSTNTPKLTRQ